MPSDREKRKKVAKEVCVEHENCASEPQSRNLEKLGWYWSFESVLHPLYFENSIEKLKRVTSRIITNYLFLLTKPHTYTQDKRFDFLPLFSLHAQNPSFTQNTLKIRDLDFLTLQTDCTPSSQRSRNPHKPVNQAPYPLISLIFTLLLAPPTPHSTQHTIKITRGS